MIKLKDLLNEGLDPKAQRFLDAIQVIDRDIKDLKHITVDATPQGNWSVYFKGKRMGTINGKMLDDTTIMKYGLEEGLNEDGFPGGAGVGLSLPGGYINGAPSYDKVKSTKKRIQNDKNDRYTEVEKK